LFLGTARTIELMNKKAAAVLMNDTAFCDVHGLSSCNISTAKDIFYLVRYIANNRPILFDITRGKTDGVDGAANFYALPKQNFL